MKANSPREASEITKLENKPRIILKTTRQNTALNRNLGIITFTQKKTSNLQKTKFLVKFITWTELESENNELVWDEVIFNHTLTYL